MRVDYFIKFIFILFYASQNLVNQSICNILIHIISKVFLKNILIIIIMLNLLQWVISYDILEIKYKI